MADPRLSAGDVRSLRVPDDGYDSDIFSFRHAAGELLWTGFHWRDNVLREVVGDGNTKENAFYFIRSIGSDEGFDAACLTPLAWGEDRVRPE